METDNLAWKQLIFQKHIPQSCRTVSSMTIELSALIFSHSFKMIFKNYFIVYFF